MVHRYFAGTLAVVITLLLVWAVRFRRDRNQPLTPVTALFVVVCLQAALGALTVTMLLKPLIVTAHLLGGLTTLGLLWWLSLAPATPQLTEQEATLRKYAVVGLAVLVMQIARGGWGSGHYAAEGFPAFPSPPHSWGAPAARLGGLLLWR